jgi:transcription antitermination factor NusG
LVEAGSKVNTMNNMSWYAVRVRGRSELVVAESLAAKDVECFLPSWEERRVYTDRVRRMTIAAFPGYLFCRIDLAERVRTLSTPGVQHLVGSERGPEAIDDDVVISLQKAFSRADRASLVSYLQAGDRIRVLDGPMAGATGILVRSKTQQRLVISVNVLERSIAVEVDGASVIRVGPPGATLGSASAPGIAH